MTKNREVFAIDPLSIPKIPNDGVTTIGLPASPDEWDVLRYELTSFVCKGEYERGLDRILSSYLANFGEDRQPAVWVSGFYGSGKSHFVRVLEAIWRDYEFPDGATARGIVDLPSAVTTDLAELSTQAKRSGGVWAAAGTLGAGAGGSFRLAFLSIVFRSAGLPTSGYAPARFVIWLQKEGLFEQFCTRLTEEGRDADEFKEFLVSPVIAKILLELVPDFATDLKSARSLLKAQFPTVNDISDDEMLETFDDVLRLQSEGKAKNAIPLTLIVLDELQQFIGEDNQRLTNVQSIVEAITARFKSRVLVVATGQSALQSSPVLAKFQDRFTVRVQLSDVDVETVVREVVLRKKPDRDAEVRQKLDQVSGEIAKHLQGTAIQPEGADKDDLVPDYALLPTRRRFWERALRAVDRGTAGQLRSQLRVTFEALREVADLPLGHVIPADALFAQKRTNMLNTGVLLPEIDEKIAQQQDGSPDGELRSRLLALIFLIARLPVDLGVRATSDTLSDLAVIDLDAGSSDLRRRVPELLEPLLQRDLMLLDGEYKLQTKEGATWLQAYEERANQLRGDDGKIAFDREQELRDAVEASVRPLSIVQGDSKTTRKLALSFAEHEPPSGGPEIPVWARSGWSVSEKEARDAAIRAGVDSPIVFVYLPKQDTDLLKRRLVEFHAATDTLNAQPIPATDEGKEARDGMQSRQARAREALDLHIRDIVDSAVVLKGGGVQADGTSTRDRVDSAARDGAARLYPHFGEADDSRWGTVIKRANEGASDALSVLGYTGDSEKHPVCARVLAFLGAGKRGSDVHKHFEGPPFGWPRDAVNAALLVLLVNGHLTARRNTVEVTAKQLTLTKIGVTDFRAETITISAQQRIDLASFLGRVGISVAAGEVADGVTRLLEQLVGLSSAAGGEPPAPAVPPLERIGELRALAGNERLLAVWGERDDLEAMHVEWTARSEAIRARSGGWAQLLRLQAHAAGLPVAQETTPQVTAILEHRQLLADPDPIPPLTVALSTALRDALLARCGSLNEALGEARASLEASSEWSRLSEQDRSQIVADHLLADSPSPAVGTDDELLAALDAAPLHTWPDRIAAVAVRGRAAVLAAAKKLEPATVAVDLPRRTLRTVEEVEAYVAEIRALLMERMAEGNPLVVD